MKINVNVNDLDINKVMVAIEKMKETYNPPTLLYEFEHHKVLSIVKHNRDFEFSLFSRHNNPQFRHCSLMEVIPTKATKDEMKRLIAKMISEITDDEVLNEAI